MNFREVGLQGAFIIEPERLLDSRGYFARTWCQREFRDHGLNPRLAQCNISYNSRKGTLRGLHYQVEPHQEAKLVMCPKGEIYDVILDLRPESATFGQHFGVYLNAENKRMLYVPEGFAHGFQTMADDTEVFYLISEFYAPEAARGVRWNDPYFRIQWPEVRERVLSERDRNYSDFVNAAGNIHGLR